MNLFLEILAAIANIVTVVAFGLGLFDRWREYKHKSDGKEDERRG